MPVKLSVCFILQIMISKKDDYVCKEREKVGERRQKVIAVKRKIQVSTDLYLKSI